MRAFTLLALAFAAISGLPALAQMQPQPRPVSAVPFAELAAGYSWAHSNVPPAGCGCFGLNGGGVQFAWPLSNSGFSLAGDVSVLTQSNAAASGTSLTLTSFLAGARYRPARFHGAWQPFGEVLAGGSHASGTLIASPNPAAANAGLAFAGMTGGGIDLRLNSRFSLRLIQADYLVTTFDNGGDNRQNNLRLLTGVVVHFAR